MARLARILGGSITALTFGMGIGIGALVPEVAQATLTFGGTITVSGNTFDVPGPLLAGFHDNGFGTTTQSFVSPYIAGDFVDLPLIPDPHITYSNTLLDLGLGESTAEFGARYTSNFFDDFTLDMDAGFAVNGISLTQIDLQPPNTDNGLAELTMKLWIPFTTDISGTGTFSNSFVVTAPIPALGPNDSVLAEMCVYPDVGDLLLDATAASCASKGGVHTTIANLGPGAPLPAAVGGNVLVTANASTLFILVATWELKGKNDPPLDLSLSDFGFGFGSSPPPPAVPLLPSGGLGLMLILGFLGYRQIRRRRLMPVGGGRA